MGATTPYVSIKLDGEQVDIPQTAELPVAITYEIEAEDDFRQKKAGTALDLTVPATTLNSKKFNTLYNPGSEDFTPGKSLRDKPVDFLLVGAGHELMKGKAFMLGGSKQFGKPKDLDLNAFGDNADWVIPNKELTLQEVLGTTPHTFDKSTMEASWAFDGTDETNDFVYAPTRNREPFGIPNSTDIPDEIFRPINMRPALSLFWMLYRGFKKQGYKISSQFFDSNYFRRMVLPWTWGNFFYITDKLLKEMGFLATGPIADTGHGDGSSQGINGAGPAYSWFAVLEGGYTGSTTDNDVAHYDSGDAKKNFFLDNVTTDIGYVGNALEYSYNAATGEAAWTYLTAYAALGVITVGLEFKLSASLDCSFNSNCSCNLDIFVNGSLTQNIPNLFAASAPTIGTDTDFGTRTFFFEVPNLNPGDVVSIKLNTHLFKSTFGYSFMKIISTGQQIALDPTNIAIQEDVRSYFKLNYIRRQLGSTINWADFDKFKNYKWLDLLRGTIDMFNLQLNTDPTSKTVLIEPTHGYDLGPTLAAPTNPGYYNGNVLDWTQKEDLSKVSRVDIFQDYEREVIMQLQDDQNDGMLKLMQDRHQAQLTCTKYVFPERFKKGSKKIENRFFSGVVHYEHSEWKAITGVAPQLICLIPENIANTSNPESEYTFAPKLAYYKGKPDSPVASTGGWNWDGDTSQGLPEMFAVNYKPGGENDPVLTYNDQRISDGSGSYVQAFGLFKRFYWQRFAIMRHGALYRAAFMLNNTDVINWLHREFKGINGQRYQLIKIDSYKPLLPISTECNMWKWHPITQEDADNTYPSDSVVIDAITLANTPDILYIPLLCLRNDIP